MSRRFLIVFSFLALLSGCVKQAPSGEPFDEVADPTAVTSIVALSPESGSEIGVVDDGSARSSSSEADTGRESSQAENELRANGSGDAAAGSREPLNLNLKPPQSGENVDHLFSGSDRGPNYFKSGQENKDSVRLKGKLYMIDEPVPEKRIQNVDGGEVGIIVPLR